MIRQGWMQGWILVILGLAAGAHPLSAQEAKSLFSNSVWQAFSYTEGGVKVCYAAARADRTQGGNKGRAGTTIAITHRGKTVNEVSLIGDYGFKADSSAEVRIGTAKYAFFTKGRSAWAKDSKGDQAVLAAMAKGKDLTVAATPAKGPAITDSIPLTGFGQALAAIDKACGVKR